MSEAVGLGSRKFRREACRRLLLAAALLLPVHAGAARHHTARASSNKPYDPALLAPAKLNAQAPAEFDAKFVTTKGNFVIHVTRAWAPLGADRFYNLMRHRFYNHASIFRVMPKFVVQFGISAYPEVSKAWHDADIKDDPVTKTNAVWTVAFATDGPNTRTTQIFINVANNPKLDARGFSPFGKVTEGTRTVRKFYSGYGEAASKQQDDIEAQGAKFIARNYPKLDSIKSAAIIPGSIVAAAPGTPRAPSSDRPPVAAAMAAPMAASAKAPTAKQPMMASAVSANSKASTAGRSKPAPMTADPSTPAIRAIPAKPAAMAGGNKPMNAAASSATGGEAGSDAASIPPDSGSPSYAETSAWIVEKVTGDAGNKDDDGATVAYSNVSLNDCQLKYHEVWHSGYSDAYDEYDVSIPLLKLSAARAAEGVVRITASTTAVHIARKEKVRAQPGTTSSEINVARTDGTYQNGDFGYVVNLDFRKQGVDGVDVSRRVATALEHAATVCKENAPKPREPF